MIIKGLVIQDCVARTHRNSTESSYHFTVKFFQPKQNISFIHGLEVEVGADHTVAVDHRPTHVCANRRGVGGLDRRGTRGSRGQAIQSADQKVDQVRSRDAGQLGDVDVRDAGDVAPATKDEADFPLEVIAVGLLS